MTESIRPQFDVLALSKELASVILARTGVPLARVQASGVPGQWLELVVVLDDDGVFDVTLTSRPEDDPGAPE
ncbi:hypothetical protein JI664_21360 [Rhodobacter sp. NTK016B]|uniref:hypothetical protein n=1 Tax=Rhodobacter sp. NTK016B TaxID=2759676 RepID=UPI001A8D7AC8|nr:hypothetical protein [Rhodobacter sp. NTK016B]MBN8294535.1 hypothetical protein [Rhodobacter sp. NTK016B]